MRLRQCHSRWGVPLIARKVSWVKAIHVCMTTIVYEDADESIISVALYIKMYSAPRGEGDDDVCMVTHAYQ